MFIFTSSSSSALIFRLSMTSVDMQFHSFHHLFTHTYIFTYRNACNVHMHTPTTHTHTHPRVLAYYIDFKWTRKNNIHTYDSELCDTINNQNNHFAVIFKSLKFFVQNSGTIKHYHGREKSTKLIKQHSFVCERIYKRYSFVLVE